MEMIEMDGDEVGGIIFISFIIGIVLIGIIVVIGEETRAANMPTVVKCIWACKDTFMSTQNTNVAIIEAQSKCISMCGNLSNSVCKNIAGARDND
jgi:hypothetical protein